jgi:hypothetical protein
MVWLRNVWQLASLGAVGKWRLPNFLLQFHSTKQHSSSESISLLTLSARRLQDLWRFGTTCTVESSAWITNLKVTAVATQASTQYDSTTNRTQTTFISPSGDIAFGLKIPNVNTSDIYFTLSMPTGVTWVAIGLGSNVMASTLALMKYSSASGINATCSPLLTTGHSEPVYSLQLPVDELSGTGIMDGRFVYSGVCHNCRNWPSSSIDFTSTDQDCIFAQGPAGFTNSDDKYESV